MHITFLRCFRNTNTMRDISPCQRNLFRFCDVTVQNASSCAMRDFARIEQDAFDTFETSDNPNYHQERSRINPLDYTCISTCCSLDRYSSCTRGSARIRDQESGSETNVSSSMSICLWTRNAISKCTDIIFMETYILFIRISLILLL